MNAIWALELARDGARNLARYKMRSTLTLLGVIFGVGAVITMLAIGEGAQRTVLKEIQGLGLNNMILDSVQPPEATRGRQRDEEHRGPLLFQYGLRQRDLAQIQALFPNASVSQGHLVRHKVHFRSTRVDARVLGVAPDYFRLFQSEIVAGEPLCAVHERDTHRVALLTEQVANSLNVAGGMVGNRLRIGEAYFTVIGIVRLPSRVAGNTIFLPFRTAKQLFGTINIKSESGSVEFTQTEIGQIVVRMPDENVIPEAARVVERMIRGSHTASDVAVTVPLDLLQSKQRTQRVLNLVLIAIAAISLLVGGIGIMNIMLAVVTERIPEIGVRRAIGASRRDILFQFLAETLVLSTAGGILGCLAGIASVPIASQWTGWPGVVTIPAVATSLAVSWFVGVVFGLAPALKAAHLNPVECLRYE